MQAPTRRTAAFAAGVTAGLAAAAGVLYAAATGLLRYQAGVARRAIGKQLGDQAHRADKTYKKKLGNRLDLLLLGDSIAAGLGADRRKHTLGAQLARKLAKRTGRAVRLRTAAKVGAETSMLQDQLADLPPGYHADVAVIVVGGNDVTHRVPVASSARDLGLVVDVLREQGTEVVVGTCPDLGALTPVPQPLRSLGRRASTQLAAAQRQVVTTHGGHAVSLADVVGPFFVSHPEEMFSLDRFHPSSAGYRRTAKAILPSLMWALRLRDEMPYGHHPPAG